MSMLKDANVVCQNQEPLGVIQIGVMKDFKKKLILKDILYSCTC